MKSIIQQDYPHDKIEVIIVDDGSKDHTPEIIKSYIPNLDTRVKLV